MKNLGRQIILPFELLPKAVSSKLASAAVICSDRLKNDPII